MDPERHYPKDGPSKWQTVLIAKTPKRQTPASGRLCALLDARAIFVSLAGIVSSDVLVSTDVSTSVEEAEFRSIMVQTLSLILLTARELDELRVVLVGAVDFDADEDARGVFVNLFLQHASFYEKPRGAFGTAPLSTQHGGVHARARL